MFNEDQQQLDLRVMKTFRFGKCALQGLVDIYNVVERVDGHDHQSVLRRELAQAAGDHEAHATCGSARSSISELRLSGSR